MIRDALVALSLATPAISALAWHFAGYRDGGRYDRYRAEQTAREQATR